MDSTKIFMRRFAELIITSIIISCILTFLNKQGVITGRNQIVFALMVGSVLFFALNVKMQRKCYYEMGRYHIEYYLINTAAYLLFAAVCFAVYFVCSKEVYTWLFAITKWIRFTAEWTEIYLSALVFHFVGLMTVFFSPAGVVTEDER